MVAFSFSWPHLYLLQAVMRKWSRPCSQRIVVVWLNLSGAFLKKPREKIVFALPPPKWSGSDLRGICQKHLRHTTDILKILKGMDGSEML